MNSEGILVSRISERLAALGIVLPPPLRVPPGTGLPFPWIRVVGNRVLIFINGFTDLILGVFGAEIGAHARSAVGLYELPFNIPLEIEGEVELR
jgi:hypothetical protein